MITTPTFRGSEVTFSNDVLAYGPKITQQQDRRVVVNGNMQFDDSPLDSDVYWHSPNTI